MRIYYCGKCQRQNPSSQCEGCGRSLPSTALRNLWSDTRPVLLDAFRVYALLRVLLFALMLLLALMMAAEFLLSGERAVNLLWDGGLLPALLKAYAAGAVLGFAVLGLQGRETVQVILDPRGISRRTWIYPSRLKCWARFLRFDPGAVEYNAEGVPFMLAHQEYLAFADVRRVAYRRRAGRIALYRPHSFLFMGLHVPREEYDEAAAMIAAKTKRAA